MTHFLNILPSQNIFISVTELSNFVSQVNGKIYVFSWMSDRFTEITVNSTKPPWKRGFQIHCKTGKKSLLSLASSHHLILAAVFRWCGVGIIASPKCDFPSLDPDWIKLLFTAKFACVQLKPDNLRSQLSQSSLTCLTVLGHSKKKNQTEISSLHLTI